MLYYTLLQYVQCMTCVYSLVLYFDPFQAAVFKHLYYCWQDYENFTTGCSGQGVEAAIEKLVSQIQASELAAFSRSKDDPEVDLKKLSVPRFETVVEREERLRKEKELSEFGKVAVAFRLSTPNPRYLQHCLLVYMYIL